LISNTDSRSVVKTLLENSNKILISRKDSRSKTFILLKQEIVSKVQLNKEANKSLQNTNNSIKNRIQKSNFEIRIPKPNFNI
jgi:hypothetical protein